MVFDRHSLVRWYRKLLRADPKSPRVIDDRPGRTGSGLLKAAKEPWDAFRRFPAERPQPQTAVSRDDIVWCYRTLLGRQQVPQSVIENHTAQPDLRSLVQAIVQSEAFRQVTDRPPDRSSVEHGSANNSMVLTQSDDLTMVTYADDQVIGASIRSALSFEEGDIEKACNIIKSLGVRVKRRTFVDVGANIGGHSIYALRMGFQNTICIEPENSNFRLLRINQILNDVDGRCRNLQVAASNEEAEKHMELSPSNFGDFRVCDQVNRDGLHGEADWSTAMVPTMRLDTILSELAVDPDQVGLVWVDTQGHEGHVLEGASALASRSVPMVLEFWPYGLERSGGYKKLRDQLIAGGRRVYDLRRSIERGATAAIDVRAELDGLYETMLRGERNNVSIHTDLIVV